MGIDTRKYGPEDHIQYQVVQYIRLQYKHVLFCHVPNEGKSNVQWRVKQKALGVSKGCPDLLLFNPVGKYIGLAIELKSEKGKVSKDQQLWLSSLEARGWNCRVAYSFDEAKKIIVDYFKHE